MIVTIDGKKIAGNILEKLKTFNPPKKFLAVFFVGEDAASLSFIKQKEKTANELGVNFRLYKFSEGITKDELRKAVLKTAFHKTCGGAVVQLPLPGLTDPQYILNAIPREKDVDVLGERALGAFYAGRNPVSPPAAGVLDEIVNDLKIELKNSAISVVGLGSLVGKPIATWLIGKTRELYLLDKGSDLSPLKNSDVVVSGVGSPGLIKREMLRNNAVVVDFGCGVINGKVSGDFDASRAPTVSEAAYTPTPGGTGPILVAKLFENFYKLSGKN